MFEIVDLTQPLDAGSVSYPGDIPTFTSQRFDVGDDEILVTRLSALELHGGTHMDAPLHFVPGGSDIAGLPLRILPAIVVRAASSRIDASDIPTDCQGRAILFSTGWEAKAGTLAYFQEYPHLSTEAARRLVDRGAMLIGIDSPSADGMPENPTCPVHRILCGAGIPIVEGLVNLGSLPQRGKALFFAAFPLPFVGLEASPVRAVALIPE